MAKGFEGHHSTPHAIFINKGGLFRAFLPGWHADGQYNFELRSTSQSGAIQMGGLTHTGNHSWLNTIAEDVIKEIEGLTDLNAKARALAKLVTFLEVAGDPSKKHLVGDFVA